MKIKPALEQLNRVINLGRVEMYKPIQIAETLREFTLNKSFSPSSLETYRNLSREWRDRVTIELIGKVSTSSMRFQDDVWNPSALPPRALSILADSNCHHEVEEYIYQHVYAKSLQMIKIRKQLDKIRNQEEVARIFHAFNDPGLRTSADRLFEVFALAVLQTQIEISDFTFTLSGDSKTISGLTGKKLISIAEGEANKLELAKMGHTNAADAGLDIWTNFGVVISVKNYSLSIDLFHKVLNDTPVGLLVIICESSNSLVESELRKVANKRQVVIITKQELLVDTGLLFCDLSQSKLFLSKLTYFYDKEFPLTVTLEAFMRKRNYRVALPGNFVIHEIS